RKPNVEALAQSMAKIAQAEVESWQPGEGGDLWDYSRRLMRRFAVELLLGGPSEQANAIADKVSRLMEHKWGWGAFVPINLPFTRYGRIVRDAEQLERQLLQWVRSKRRQAHRPPLAPLLPNLP